jgi:hypothetical protein
MKKGGAFADLIQSASRGSIHMGIRSLMIEPNDRVAAVLENARRGDSIQTPRGEITLLEDIEFAYKAAIVDYAAGDPVYKYDTRSATWKMRPRKVRGSLVTI